MSSNNRARFGYHAQSVGLAASLTRPSQEIIPSLGMASLSVNGGESYSTVQSYDWNGKGLITFDGMSAYATGNFDPSATNDHGEVVGAYNTLSTVSVTNLSIGYMVHADLVVARITSKHLVGDPEGQITFEGSLIRNLVVNGLPVDITLDHGRFTANPTYAKFENQCVDGLRRGAAQFVATSDQPGEAGFHDPENKVISCSLASKVGDEESFIIPVEGFGKIYVGQVIMKPSYRRISMLRFELGSPLAGDLEAGGSETNGVPYWP